MAGLRGVVAAIHYICVMDQQQDEMLQSDVHHLSSFWLVFAATLLLLVEMAGGAPQVVEVRTANAIARKLLQRLSSHNRAVLACLESIQVIHALS